MYRKVSQGHSQFYFFFCFRLLTQCTPAWTFCIVIFWTPNVLFLIFGICFCERCTLNKYPAIMQGKLGWCFGTRRTNYLKKSEQTLKFCYWSSIRLRLSTGIFPWSWLMSINCQWTVGLCCGLYVFLREM